MPQRPQPAATKAPRSSLAEASNADSAASLPVPGLQKDAVHYIYDANEAVAGVTCPAWPLFCPGEGCLRCVLGCY